MSEELKKRVKHATEMYYHALALDAQAAREETRARLVARADAAAVRGIGHVALHEGDTGG